MFASIINQLNNGGSDLITTNTINNDKKALKLFVLIFLLIESKNFKPEYSILIKWSPVNPKINGKKKLIGPGKKETISLLKKEFKKTINILRATKMTPVYR